jgi:hypothetical protein
VADYGITPLDQTIRSDMEVGAARVRRRTSYQMWTTSLSWFLTDAQVDTFQTWVQVDISGGASWFDINLAIGDTGIDAVEARFIGPPTYKRNAGPATWIVTAQAEVRP